MLVIFIPLWRALWYEASFSMLACPYFDESLTRQLGLGLGLGLELGLGFKVRVRVTVRLGFGLWLGLV